MKRMFTDWPPILGSEDWDWGASELDIIPHCDDDPDDLPPVILVDATLLTRIWMYGTEIGGTFQMGDVPRGYVGGVLRLPQKRGTAIYRVTGWEHSIGALRCEWPD